MTWSENKSTIACWVYTQPSISLRAKMRSSPSTSASSSTYNSWSLRSCSKSLSRSKTFRNSNSKRESWKRSRCASSTSSTRSVSPIRILTTMFTRNSCMNWPTWQSLQIVRRSYLSILKMQRKPRILLNQSPRWRRKSLLSLRITWTPFSRKKSRWLGECPFCSTFLRIVRRVEKSRDLSSTTGAWW